MWGWDWAAATALFIACVMSADVRRADCLCLKLQTVDALIFRRILLINGVGEAASYHSAALPAAGLLPDWEVLPVEYSLASLPPGSRAAGHLDGHRLPLVGLACIQSKTLRTEGFSDKPALMQDLT